MQVFLRTSHGRREPLLYLGPDGLQHFYVLETFGELRFVATPLRLEAPLERAAAPEASAFVSRVKRAVATALAAA